MSQNNSVTFPWGKVWLDEELQIVRVAFVAGTQQTLEHAREQIATVKQLTKGQKQPFLVDLRNVRTSDAEARKYFAGPESRAAWRAVGFLTGTPLSNAVINLWFAANNSKENPVKMFNQEAEAIEWLKKFL